MQKTFGMNNAAKWNHVMTKMNEWHSFISPCPSTIVDSDEMGRNPFRRAFIRFIQQVCYTEVVYRSINQTVLTHV